MPNDSKSLANRALTTICIMEIVWVGIGWNTLSLYAAPITGEWGITRAAFMLTITLVATCNTIISMFLYGRLVEKLGIRKLIVIGGILCTLGFICFALAQNIAMLYLTGVLFGSGCALVNNNAVNSVCQMWYKKNTGTYISIASTFGSVTGIIAATAVAALIAGVGWRPSLWIIAGISIVGMVVCALTYKGSPDELGVAPVGADDASSSTEGAQGSAAADGGVAYSDMLKTGKFWLLALVMLIIGIVGYGIMANLPVLAGDYGFEEFSGTALSVALLASAIFLIPGGRILDKAGSSVMIAICFVFLIVAMAIMLVGAVNLPMLYVIAALVGAAYDMCVIAPAITTIEAFGSRDYAKKQGTICGFTYAGVALAPTVLALFYDMSGSYSTAFVICIALAVVAMVLIFPLTRNKKKAA